MTDTEECYEDALLILRQRGFVGLDCVGGVEHVAVDMTNAKPLFKLNDAVIKHTGDYKWRGIVVSVFYTPQQLLRYVVAHPVTEGWVLHIYSERNLRPVEQRQAATGPDETDGTEDERGDER